MDRGRADIAAVAGQVDGVAERAGAAEAQGVGAADVTTEVDDADVAGRTAAVRPDSQGLSEADIGAEVKFKPPLGS